MSEVFNSLDLLLCVFEQLGAPHMCHAAPVSSLWRRMVLGLGDTAPWRQLCKRSSPLLMAMRGRSSNTWSGLYQQWLSLASREEEAQHPPVRSTDFSLGLELRSQSTGAVLFAWMGELAGGVDSVVMAETEAEPGQWPLNTWVRESGECAWDYENTLELTCFL